MLLFSNVQLQLKETVKTSVEKFDFHFFVIAQFVYSLNARIIIK